MPFRVAAIFALTATLLSILGGAQAAFHSRGAPLESLMDGLPIMRRIAVAHVGELHVEFKAGSGTTITILLPLDDVAPPAPVPT